MNMLPIHSFLFNSNEFKVYGTHEEPLFSCLDIAKILGYKETNSNWFYQKNKDNKDFVVALRNSDSLLQEKYFTEIGLYECLFANKSDIAKMFRKDIIQLIKNIRLGNISIHINRIDELEKQLAETKEIRDKVIAEYKTRLEQTDTLIKRATKKLGIYEVKVGDKVYRGRSHNPESRIKRHLSHSSNPSIREAVRSGEHIETSILGTFDVITRADADHIERQYIEAIPKETRLNRMLPVANETEVVIRNEMIVPADQPTSPITTEIPIPDQTESPIQILEEIKQQNDIDDLDTILEQSERETVAGNDVNLDMMVDQWFAGVIQKVKEFRQTNGRYPTDSIHSNTPEEQKLGVLCVKLRLGIRLGKWFKMTPERLLYIQQELPDFAIDREAQLRWEQFTQPIDTLAHRLARGLGYPKQVKNRNTAELKQERNLYEVLLRIQQQYQKGELSEDKIQYIKEKIPNFAFGNRHDNQFNDNVQKLKDFGRLPTRSEDPKLYLFVSKTRVKIRDNELETDRIQLLKTACPFFS